MADELFDHKLAEIVELIEAAAFDPELWDGAVDAIWEQMPGTKLVLHTRDEGMPGTGVVVMRGWEEHHIATYEAHYAALNPWVGVMASMPLMVPVWTEDTLPASAFAETEFYADWLRKVEDAQCATGIKLMQTKERNASLDLHYGTARKEDYHRRARTILASVSPALHRSIGAMRLQHAARARSILDLLTDAAFIVSETGAVTALNAAAQELVDNRIVVLRMPGGRLSVQSETADRALYQEIADTYRQPATSHAAAIRAIVADQLLLMSVFPIAARTSSHASSLAGMASLFQPRREALVVVRRRPRDREDGVQQFAARFGLSPTEARLAGALRNGASLGQAAEQLGIAYETARSHLRGIFGKTGVRRQIDLVRLMMADG